MAPPAKKQLASKEQNLFKELLSQYETRQLKKGVKTADAILKKVPDHGETLCMKGLLLTHQGKREEGLELVKKGILLDLTSHIVWHVYGLIQKGQKDYEGALKSYTQALRCDKDNLNLLNDTANLQTQLRQFEALRETREHLLKLRPNIRRNWLSLAVTYQLCGDVAGANKVMEKYMTVVKNVPDYDFEHSELTLYHISILEELGELEKALTMLDTNAKSRVIIDRVAIMETRARLLTKLGSDEAESSWRSLIEKNSNCYEYYKSFFSQKQLPFDSVSDEKSAEVLQLLDELANQHPKATAPRRIALNISTGDDFRDRTRTYLTNGFLKGIPSIFSDIKSLYKDASKERTVEEVAEELKTQFSHNNSNGTTENGNASESPSAYLWTLYFLAQHYSHIKQYSKSLTVVDEAIEHTPTLPELYACKARCLKRAGDLLGAVRCMEDARVLDKADRFLNTKSAKYHLRAGLSGEAQTILGLFTKKDAPSPGSDLEDMQSALYLSEEAGCQRRLGQLGPALKKYIALQKILREFSDDQYDFHYYAIRRATIKSYMKMLKWEDDLPINDNFLLSAVEAAKIYVQVHDDPSLVSKPSAGSTNAEKKAQKKAKKAAAKVQEEAKKNPTTSNNTSSNEDKGIEPGPTKDEDADGSKALAATDGLDQAWKLLKPLALRNVDRVDVSCAIYDVAVRQGKFSQATKALLAMRSVDKECPDLHVRVIDLQRRISTLEKPLLEPVGPAVNAALSTLFPADIAAETYNSQYLQTNGTRSLAILAVVQAFKILSTPLNEIEDTVFSVLAPETDLSIKSASQAIELLSSIKSSRIAEFREACDKRFELSTVFKPDDELQKLQSELRDLAQKREEGKIGPASEAKPVGAAAS